jgi:hypothetical protein
MQLVKEGHGFPAGVRPFLLAASVRRVGATLVVELPAGPGLERLRAADVRQNLEAILEQRTGESLRLDFREGTEAEVPGVPGRISQQEVKQGRMSDLLEREPHLEGPVRMLDLDLRD